MVLNYNCHSNLYQVFLIQLVFFHNYKKYLLKNSNVKFYLSQKDSNNHYTVYIWSAEYGKTIYGNYFFKTPQPFLSLTKAVSNPGEIFSKYFESVYDSPSREYS